MLHGPIRGPAGEERDDHRPLRRPGQPHQPVMKAEKIEPLTTDLQVHDPRLGLLRLQTELGQQRLKPRQARPRPAPGICTSPARRRRNGPALHARARPTPGRSGAGTRCTATGLITPPCGAPVTGRRTCPSSITPARRITRSSLSTAWSQTRSSTACINFSCGIAEKQLAISVSTTHRRPRQDSSMRTCSASCAARFGPEPERARQHVRLEHRLQHDLHRGLHDPVTNRRESTTAASRP